MTRVALLCAWSRGEVLFEEGDPPERLLGSRSARLSSSARRSAGPPKAEGGGVFILLALDRQELADPIRTPIETCIRIMSRWGKEGVVRTEGDGFTILDRRALEDLAAERRGSGGGR